jgi:hypothetical protein
MNQRIPIISLLVTAATAVALIMPLMHQRDDLSKRLAESDAEQERLKAELVELRTERDQLRGQGTGQGKGQAGTPSPSISKPSKTAGNGTQTPPAGTAPAGRQAFAEMMKNPAMKEVMKQQQRVQLDMRFGGLYEHFQFDDAQKADFKQLLEERLALQSELGLKFFEGDATKDQRDAWQKEYNDGKKASDANIRSFLNSDEDFSTFQRWENSEAERMRIETGRSQYASTGEPLSPQQEQQLLDVMYETRVARSGDGDDFSNAKVPDPEKFSEEDVSRQLSHLDEVDRSVYQAASGFLSAKQLETLRAQQQQWRSMTEAGLRMTATMFQAKKKGS